VDYRLEVARLTMIDIEKAKEFYQGLGWRLDADFHLEGGVQIVQLTPPGSACSLGFGTGITDIHLLVVDDLVAARDDLAAHGVAVGEIEHREGANFVPGLDPKRQSYASQFSFTDPEGHQWLVQEITERLPGRTTSPLAVYGTVENLAAALRRAAEAHGRHEQELGHADEDWPSWYAQYMADEANQ
jgi:catechol 2,3-dioxygenase-like lactoylglutathione lyase family enzyme